MLILDKLFLKYEEGWGQIDTPQEEILSKIQPY